MVEVSVASFSMTPGGRRNQDGPYSGEAFLSRFLVPAFETQQPVIVNLDGVAGLPPSFLEAAFGGLVRLNRWPTHEILERMKIVAEDPGLRSRAKLIERFVREAGDARAH